MIFCYNHRCVVFFFLVQSVFMFKKTTFLYDITAMIVASDYSAPLRLLLLFNQLTDTTLFIGDVPSFSL